MAIKIENLESVASQFINKSYTYKDLSLDLKLYNIESGGYQPPIPGADIKVSYDVAAIANSLSNLFNTLPGQRFLFPEYGLDLYRYLFEPITKFNAQTIGNYIYQSVKIYEPRVTPRNINVRPEPDNNIYYITIVLEIPELNTTTEIGFDFDIKKQQFITVPTSRNL
jgi:phage baseplate assembly protein W